MTTTIEDERANTPTLLADDDGNDEILGAPSLFSIDDGDDEDDVDDSSPWPCTPTANRIPLCFADAPPAPRPRKRAHHQFQFIESDLRDLMIPDTRELESRVFADTINHGAPTAWMPRPALARLTRRIGRRHFLATVPGTDSDTENEAPVRLSYRANDPEEETQETLPVSSSSSISSGTSSSSSTKLLSLDLAHPSARLPCKRRKSYTAMCA